MLPDLTLFDLIDVPIFVIAREDDGRITYRYCNAASYELTGETPETMIGHTAVEVFGERMGRNIGARHEEALNSDGSLTYEVTLPITQGEGVVRNRMTQLEDHPGAAICTTQLGGNRIADGRDLTRRARELEREADLAERALRLRGPMRKYGMLIDEVKRGFTDLGNGKIQMIDEIGRLGEEAYDLVRQVLSYTRAVAARPEQPERVDLVEFCETLFATFDPNAEHVLTAEKRIIVVEPPVLWFVLHELLNEGLSTAGRHEIFVRCGEGPSGMVEVSIGCTMSDTEPSPGRADHFREVESVLRSRGGRFTQVSQGESRHCSFVLPGRVITAENVLDRDNVTET